MAPFINTISVQDLGSNFMLDTKRKKRKGCNDQLDKCDLLEMLQYNCIAEENRVVCRPVERFFRRSALHFELRDIMTN